MLPFLGGNGDPRRCYEIIELYDDGSPDLDVPILDVRAGIQLFFFPNNGADTRILFDKTLAICSTSKTKISHCSQLTPGHSENADVFIITQNLIRQKSRTLFKNGYPKEKTITPRLIQRHRVRLSVLGSLTLSSPKERLYIDNETFFHSNRWPQSLSKL